MKILKTKFWLLSFIVFGSFIILFNACQKQEYMESIKPVSVTFNSLDNYLRLIEDVEKDDFIVNTSISKFYSDLNEDRIQVNSIEPFMDLKSDASKEKLKAIFDNSDFLVGSGNLSSPQFSNFNYKDKFEDIEFVEKILADGQYAVLVKSVINEMEIESIAVFGRGGIIWDNIFYLINVSDLEKPQIVIDNDNDIDMSRVINKEKSSNSNLMKMNQGGCYPLTWQIIAGHNYWGQVLATAYLGLQACWDCNGNYQEGTSYVQYKYCNSLPLTACLGDGGVLFGWGTKNIKYFIAVDYAAPGTSLALGSDPAELTISSPNIAGFDNYAEHVTPSGSISPDCNQSSSCLVGGWNNTTYYGWVYVNNTNGSFPSWVWSGTYQHWEYIYDPNYVCNGWVTFGRLANDDNTVKTETLSEYVPIVPNYTPIRGKQIDVKPIDKN